MTTLKTTVKQTMFDHNCCILLLMSINSRLIEQNRSQISLLLACEQALCLGKNSEEREGKGGERACRQTFEGNFRVAGFFFRY